MKVLYGRLVKCNHCTGWVDLLVQEFAWEREGEVDNYYHTHCWFEKYRKEATDEDRNNPLIDDPD